MAAAERGEEDGIKERNHSEKRTETAHRRLGSVETKRHVEKIDCRPIRGAT